MKWHSPRRRAGLLPRRLGDVDGDSDVNLASNEWTRRTLTFCVASSAIYAVLNPLAMLLYPGGRVTDPDTEGYSFLESFFSLLGHGLLVRSVHGSPGVPQPTP